MEFKIKVCRIDDPNDIWWEKYDKNIDDPEKFGKEVIQYFNDTLRPGEKKRKYLSFEIIDKESQEEHTWVKTNLVSLKNGSDDYKCDQCGVTANRPRLAPIFILTGKFKKAKVYKRCDTAKKHITKSLTPNQ